MRKFTGAAILLTWSLTAGAFGVHAQTPLPALSVRWGAVNYDLGGTGTSVGVAASTTRPLTDNISLEFGALITSPLQQSGDSTAVVPEAHLQYAWNLGRVAPYVGGGGGLAFIWQAHRDEIRPVLSAGGGARLRLTEQIDLQGEFRLRGVSRNFSGSMAEWLVGFAFKY